jgi:hypothetical protein
MPTLTNTRYESFAQARAKGARLADAYEDAGFVLNKGHPSRLARRPEVTQRIAELRVQRNEAEDISPHKVIATLLRMAKAGETSENASLLKEARLALLDASRLHGAMAEARRVDQYDIADEFGNLAKAAAARAVE